jgi:hypothetical protein
MAHIEIDRHTFFDITNTPRILRGVCVDRVTDLRLLYKLFWSEIQKLDPTIEIDFKDACHKSERVLNTATAIAELCGIPSDWFDLDLLAVLVHSSIDESGMPQRGYIAQIHFKIDSDPRPVSEETKEFLTFDQYYVELLTTLAQTEGSLQNAKKVLADPNLSQVEVEEYLATKAERIEKTEKDPNGAIDKIRKGKAKYKDLKAKADARKAQLTKESL